MDSREASAANVSKNLVVDQTEETESCRSMMIPQEEGGDTHTTETELERTTTSSSSSDATTTNEAVLLQLIDESSSTSTCYGDKIETAEIDECLLHNNKDDDSSSSSSSREEDAVPAAARGHASCSSTSDVSLEEEYYQQEGHSRIAMKQPESEIDEEDSNNRGLHHLSEAITVDTSCSSTDPERGREGERTCSKLLLSKQGEGLILSPLRSTTTATRMQPKDKQASYGEAAGDLEDGLLLAPMMALPSPLEEPATSTSQYVESLIEESQEEAMTLKDSATTDIIQERSEIVGERESKDSGLLLSKAKPVDSSIAGEEPGGEIEEERIYNRLLLSEDKQEDETPITPMQSTRLWPEEGEAGNVKDGLLAPTAALHSNSRRAASCPPRGIEKPRGSKKETKTMEGKDGATMAEETSDIVGDDESVYSGELLSKVIQEGEVPLLLRRSGTQPRVELPSDEGAMAEGEVVAPIVLHSSSETAVPSTPCAEAEPVPSSDLDRGSDGSDTVIYDQYAIPVADVEAVDNASHTDASEDSVPPGTYKRIRLWLRLSIVALMTVLAIAIAVPVVLSSNGSADHSTVRPSSPPTDDLSTVGPRTPPANITVIKTESPKPELDSHKCFETRTELLIAIDYYMFDNSNTSTVAETYGWPMNAWCVKNIKNMNALFSADRKAPLAFFDEPLGQWNVSRAVSMRRMFRSVFDFDQNLSNWSVGNVRNMNEMFRSATRFQQNLCPWRSHLKQNVNVTDMFLETNCEVQDDPNLTETDGHFCSMCDVAIRDRALDADSDSVYSTSFEVNETETDGEHYNSRPRCFQSRSELYSAVDQYLADNSRDTEVAREYGWPINNWCVSRVTSFSRLFSSSRNPRAASFNERLSDWGVSRATDMNLMFEGATSFSGSLESWDVSSVESMRAMFRGAKAFRSDLSRWDVSSVEDFSFMFAGASRFASDLSSWRVSSAKTMNAMFYQATSFNADLSSWRVGRVYNTGWMFAFATSFSRDLCPWGEQLSRNVNVDSMFLGSGCRSRDDPNLAAEPPGPLCFPCD